MLEQAGKVPAVVGNGCKSERRIADEVQVFDLSGGDSELIAR